jgi:hypothetical protein
VGVSSVYLLSKLYSRACMATMSVSQCWVRLRGCLAYLPTLTATSSKELVLKLNLNRVGDTFLLRSLDLPVV